MLKEDAGIDNREVAMSYEKLEKRFRVTGGLRHGLAMLFWDAQTKMPPGGGTARSEAVAAQEMMIHRLLTAPDLGELLESATGRNPWELANLAEMRRQWTRAIVIPADLVGALAQATSTCEQVWLSARPRNDWAAVAGKLENVISLTRQRAAALAETLDCDAYDALLDEFEAGMSRAIIDPIFTELAQVLPPMIDAAIDRQVEPLKLQGEYSEACQEALARELMTDLGFDFSRGRLDVSAHPFTGGVRDDTRLTTRFDPTDLFKSIMAVIHENGHGLYQQNLPASWAGQPVGEAGGSALHESQSLLFEHQIARSDAFLEFVAPIVQRHAVGAETDDPEWQPENLARLVRQVERGLIRVDADELTYPLHIVLRYEIEAALIDGSLAVSDLPEAWDSKMRQYLGLSTAGDYANGVLQDIHFFAGLFGYFATYSIGAVMAAQFHRAAKRDIDGLDDAIRKGEFNELHNWLGKNVHSLGRSKTSMEILESATGSSLGTAAFLEHLNSRYVT